MKVLEAEKKVATSIDRSLCRSLNQTPISRVSDLLRPHNTLTRIILVNVRRRLSFEILDHPGFFIATRSREGLKQQGGFLSLKFLEFLTSKTKSGFIPTLAVIWPMRYISIPFIH